MQQGPLATQSLSAAQEEEEEEEDADLEAVPRVRGRRTTKAPARVDARIEAQGCDSEEEARPARRRRRF